MQDLSTITVEVDGAVCSVTLDRPEKLNPLSVTCQRELIEVAEWLDAQPEIRAVVIRGAGRAFSAGADLSSFGTDAALEPRESGDLGLRMVEAIAGIDAVTIAAVHGHCIGGGVLLATACDLRIADEEARFAIPEVDLGIPLTWSGIPRLVREIGPAATKDLVLSCRRFGADEARLLGVVTRVVSVGDLDRAARELAEEMARRSRYAVRSVLEAVDACAEEMVGTGRSWADADQLATAFHDAESREAGARYLAERRK
ncbi:MAG: enoyl-CoA hydratase/isomerase family protein [Actinomycetota bacterium]